MININIVTIESKQGKREIYPTPVKLNWEELVKLKRGKITKMYLYDDLRDKQYFENMSYLT
ncbi:hypothetical protein [Desertivirga arenae]|uniref:hypothetical protein n=1 Tax=Desertivirga arenae TaxID=2810309 RepID=UPI001A96A8A9|nr:hypothetical protein [Pedobacter sp. SYSU D00823]